MNTISLRSTFVVLLALIASHLDAQLTLSGEFRPRTEYSHGYKALAADNQTSSLFTSQRTRLNFAYKGAKLKTGLVLQDVRNWGSQPQLISNQDFAASIHQAWLEYNLLPSLSLKAGRQELVYDNHRILGNVGWAQQARSHDLFLVKYKGSIELHAGLAYHQDANRTNGFYFGPDAYKSMQFLWANRKSESLNISLLLMNNGVSNPKDTIGMGPIQEQGINYSQTVGPVISYSRENLGFNLESYFQGGKDGAGNDLSAWYTRVEAVLKRSGSQITAGYEYLSGTDFDATGSNGSFTPFYGTNHKFNGFMDYFYVGNHVNNVGLQDIFLKAKVSAGKVTLNGHLHLFSSAAQIAAGTDAYLGTEVDLVCNLKLDETFNITAGYSHMFPGSSMQLLKGGSTDTFHNWAWLMLTVKPVFLQTGE